MRRQINASIFLCASVRNANAILQKDLVVLIQNYFKRSKHKKAMRTDIHGGSTAYDEDCCKGTGRLGYGISLKVPISGSSSGTGFSTSVHDLMSTCLACDLLRMLKGV